MFVRCLIGQVASMNREKGGRHNQFLDKWLKEFGLLQTRGSGDDLSMICKDCTKAGKKSTFTSGCKNFQRSALVRHMSQVDHKSSAKVLLQQKKFKSSKGTIIVESSESLCLMLICSVYLILTNDHTLVKSWVVNTLM